MLLHDNSTRKLLKDKQLFSCINENSSGRDLDANSNSALIVDDGAMNDPLASNSTEMIRRSSSAMPKKSLDQLKIQQYRTLSSGTISIGATHNRICRNSNYELTDLDKKTTNYR